MNRVGCCLALLVASCTPQGSGPPLEGGRDGATASSASTTILFAGDARPPPSETSVEFRGTYRSAPGAFYVPDAGEWSGVKWRGDDAGDGVGEGTLALTLDATSGRVAGTATGAIGDALLTGAALDGQLAATVRRKDPGDRGLTGTLVATRTGDRLDGSMRLSFGDAHSLREATFTLAKSPSP